MYTFAIRSCWGCELLLLYFFFILFITSNHSLVLPFFVCAKCLEAFEFVIYALLCLDLLITVYKCVFPGHDNSSVAFSLSLLVPGYFFLCILLYSGYHFVYFFFFIFCVQVSVVSFTICHFGRFVRRNKFLP